MKIRRLLVIRIFENFLGILLDIRLATPRLALKVQSLRIFLWSNYQHIVNETDVLQRRKSCWKVEVVHLDQQLVYLVVVHSAVTDNQLTQMTINVNLTRVMSTH